jgi:hypothetical protein
MKDLESFACGASWVIAGKSGGPGNAVETKVAFPNRLKFFCFAKVLKSKLKCQNQILKYKLQ